MLLRLCAEETCVMFPDILGTQAIERSGTRVGDSVLHQLVSRLPEHQSHKTPASAPASTALHTNRTIPQPFRLQHRSHARTRAFSICRLWACQSLHHLPPSQILRIVDPHADGSHQRLPHVLTAPRALSLELAPQGGLEVADANLRCVRHVGHKATREARCQQSREVSRS